jgi:hypothetical protein
MHFELIDEYLLTGAPRKAEVIERLLADRSTVPGAAPFYEGMKILGARTPDLTLVALRLVMAGKTADDANVVALRREADAARLGGDGAATAREAYKKLLLALLCLVLVFAGGGRARAQAAPLPSAPVIHGHRVRGAITQLRNVNGRYFLLVNGNRWDIEIVPTTAISRDRAYASVSDLRVGTHVDIVVSDGPNGLIAQSILIER